MPLSNHADLDQWGFCINSKSPSRCDGSTVFATGDLHPTYSRFTKPFTFAGYARLQPRSTTLFHAGSDLPAYVGSSHAYNAYLSSSAALCLFLVSCLAHTPDEDTTTRSEGNLQCYRNPFVPLWERALRRLLLILLLYTVKFLHLEPYEISITGIMRHLGRKRVPPTVLIIEWPLYRTTIILTHRGVAT